MIFDGHAYTFPSLKGNGEFDTPEQLQRHLQQAIGAHHQPPVNVRDGSPGDNSDLIDMANWPSLDSLKECNFRTASNGRFEWTANGQDYYKQYFPPLVTDMEYPAERLVAEMDYAGVTKALLHRTPYLGVGNKFISECVSQFPDRLKGLAHVEEWLIAPDPEGSLEKVEWAINEGGLSGLHFLPPQMNLYNQSGPWDSPECRTFWDGFAKLGVPVFFSVKERVEPRMDSMLDEIKTLIRWTERYPDVQVVITHGVQWRLFMDETSINFPEEIWAPYQNPNVYQQFLFPIALGAIWEYPMPQVHSAIEECVKRIGADRIMWGTDMPIVMRFWTYKQNIEFIARHCDFLSKEDTDQIMGGTVAKLLGVDWPESGSGHSVTR